MIVLLSNISEKIEHLGAVPPCHKKVFPAPCSVEALLDLPPIDLLHAQSHPPIGQFLSLLFGVWTGWSPGLLHGRSVQAVIGATTTVVQ
jgi:hypothetical protein